MKIAVLAWGSLVCNPGTLSLATEWRPEGPILPIEFSRISDNSRLTLVIDERDGARVQTFFALSSLGDTALAISELMKREGMRSQDRVGCFTTRPMTCSARAQRLHPAACDSIVAWCKASSLDAVIWTALGPRFKAKADEEFSPEAAIRYLKGLEGDVRTKALRYIREAPVQVQTPVRQLVERLLV
jgi:hypothetical protein